MKIAVCIKQVPVVSMLKFDEETKRVVRDGVPSEVNPFDVAAMSAVINLKQELPVESVVITMGPPQARDALVQCLAMGADRAIHLVDRAFAGSDTLATSRALAAALSREQFDLIVCGSNSTDSETGQVGPEIAEFLGIPQVTGVRKLEINDNGNSITVERLTDDGHEVINCDLPALIATTEEIATDIYPRREELEAAASKPLAELTAADIADDVSTFGTSGSPTSVSDLYSVEINREQVLVRDKPVEEAVGMLMNYLTQRGAFEEHQESSSPTISRSSRRAEGENNAIWVFAELLGGEVSPVTFELLGKASELAPRVNGRVDALLIGSGVERHVQDLTAYGADRVYLADATTLDGYDTENYTQVLVSAIGTHNPYAVLFPSSLNGRDLAARTAARLGLGLTGDCIDLEVDDEGKLVQIKPAFGGNIVAPILSNTMPQMATVRPGLLTPLSPDRSLSPDVHELPTSQIGPARVRVLERVVDTHIEGARLQQARRIVCVGKGIGGPDNLGVIRDLADAMGASIGATRDVTDVGWLPRQTQIGLSGKSVSPNLYIAVGVRGPFNHTVGIQRAGTIVAINNSARAPIFKAADFGILGDYAEVVPALTEAFKNRND